GARIEPPLGAGILHVPVANEIRSISILPGIALIAARPDREGPAGLPCPDAGRLPTPGDIVHNRIRWREASALPERQVKDIAEDQSMIDVVIGQPSFSPQISNILNVRTRIAGSLDA